jgi:acyl-CoA reductase-like NAD-dependent aldehyde dehydrogenase
VERFVPAVTALKTGDPLADGVDVGPMIDEANARRAEEWLAEARSRGAKVIGGVRDRAVLTPAVVLDSTSAMKVNCEEVFAPITTVRKYAEFDAALATVNDSPWGLQAGLFTNDMRKILRAFEQLDVGAVVINDVPGFRVDHAPYGGSKQSGIGREGVRYAIEEMTELRMLILGGDR